MSINKNDEFDLDNMEIDFGDEGNDLFDEDSEDGLDFEDPDAETDELEFDDPDAETEDIDFGDTDSDEIEDNSEDDSVDEAELNDDIVGDESDYEQESDNNDDMLSGNKTIIMNLDIMYTENFILDDNLL